MANGFLGRISGKYKIARLWIGGGSVVVDSDSGIGGQIIYTNKLAMSVTAVATTDYTSISLPAGKTLLRATAYTGTAFTAGTDAKISIGTSAGDQSYVAQATIAAIGVHALTLVAAQAATELALPAAPQLFVRITQSGSATAVGAATLVLEYA